MAVPIAPLIKCKVTLLSLKIYGLITIATALSNRIEKAVLNHQEAYLNTLDDQFSLNKGHGIEMCVCER